MIFTKQLIDKRIDEFKNRDTAARLGLLGSRNGKEDTKIQDCPPLELGSPFGHNSPPDCWICPSAPRESYQNGVFRAWHWLGGVPRGKCKARFARRLWWPKGQPPGLRPLSQGGGGFLAQIFLAAERLNSWR
jgi:hypothetical protein